METKTVVSAKGKKLVDAVKNATATVVKADPKMEEVTSMSEDGVYVVNNGKILKAPVMAGKKLIYNLVVDDEKKKHWKRLF
jgi:TPP-dependent trihydroxycyclohexane-1,2-dione (THcHDO) dehydratase